MIFNTLSNGMGGMDWSALPLMCQIYDVDDVEILVARLQVLKLHKPEKDDDGPGNAEH